MKHIKSILELFFGWLLDPAHDFDLKRFEELESKKYSKEWS